MGSENAHRKRSHRLDTELSRPANAVEAGSPEHALPGKQTEVERALAGLGLSPSQPLPPRQETGEPGRRTLAGELQTGVSSMRRRRSRSRAQRSLGSWAVCA
jgi:hypothetical protein